MSGISRREETGPIKDRDLGAPEMKNTWRKIQQLGFQTLPC